MRPDYRAPPHPSHGQSTGLARALSKLGFCSRRQARELIVAGRVRTNGAVRRDPEWRVVLGRDRLEADGQPVQGAARVYLMLNKPRGLVTSAADEQGRETVFRCLAQWNNSPSVPAHDRESAEGKIAGRLPRVFPVGRLDKASEGLLLFTNDTAWAAWITDPTVGLDKTYHVQVDCLADETLLWRMRMGVKDQDDFLAVKQVRLLRGGVKNSWLEVVLDEGKNRHLRRLLAALEVRVLRLVRVAIGSLQLGPLAKGQVRHLTPAEVRGLSREDPMPPRMHENGH